MQKIFAVFVACIFGNKKFRSRKKCCSQDFMSFYRLQKNNFGQQFPYFFSPPPKKNCFIRIQSRLLFYFFLKYKIHMQKKTAVFVFKTGITNFLNI